MKKVALLIFVLLATLTLAPTVASADLAIEWITDKYEIRDNKQAEVTNPASGTGWALASDANTLTLSDGYASGAISIAPKTDALFTLVYRGEVTVDREIFFYTSGTPDSDDGDFTGVEVALTGENGTLTVTESFIGQLGGKMTIGGSGTIITPQIACAYDPEIVIQGSVSLKITQTSTKEPVFGILSGNYDDRDPHPATPLTYGPITINTTGTVEVTSPAYALIGSPITLNSGTVKLKVDDAQKAYDTNGAALVVNGGELYVNGVLVAGADRNSGGCSVSGLGLVALPLAFFAVRKRRA